MSERSGDGPHPILFGTAPFPARTQTHRGYLARPGVHGTFPTIVLLAPAAGLTGSVTWLCRFIARWGFAVVAPDLYRGAGPPRRASPDEIAEFADRVSDARAVADIGDVIGFVESPGTEWSSPHRIGLMGVGEGGRFATLAAAESGEADGLCLAYAPFDDGGRSHDMTEAFVALHMAILGLYGRKDDEVDVDRLAAIRDRQPRAEWVLYQDAGHGFLDDAADTYDPAAAVDARGRVVEFFERVLAEDRRPVA